MAQVANKERSVSKRRKLILLLSLLPVVLLLLLVASWVTTYYTGTYTIPKGEWGIHVRTVEGEPIKGARIVLCHLGVKIHNPYIFENYENVDTLRTDESGTVVLRREFSEHGGIEGWEVLWIWNTRSPTFVETHELRVSADGYKSYSVPIRTVFDSTSPQIVTLERVEL